MHVLLILKVRRAALFSLSRLTCFPHFCVLQLAYCIAAARYAISNGQCLWISIYVLRIMSLG